MASEEDVMNRYEYTDILACAETLHEHTTGSGDALPKTEETRVLEFLNMRLREWQTTLHEKSRQYDEAVRNLVQAAIDEYMHSHWNMPQKVFELPQFVCDCGRTDFFIYVGIEGTQYHCTYCGRKYSSTSAPKGMTP